MMNNYGSSPIRKTRPKSLWIAMLILLFGYTANAQVSTYTFAQSAGTYTPITGGTVLGTATNDDNIFAGNPIGFSFCYNGATYTEFGVCANGWIYMGNATGSNSYTALSTGATNNVISAFNFDIQGEAGLGDLRYQTIGTAPNRELVVQWSNYDAYQSVVNTDVYNFQIRLSESNGQIQTVYNNWTANGFHLAQVGLRGASSADFNNREVSNGITTWATSTAGALNSSSCESSIGLAPANGQTYTWSQPAAPAPPTTLTFTGVTTTGMTLNWVDNSTNEATFFVYRSTDNITFTLVNTQVSTSIATTGTPYTYAATGLFSGTTYYWRVFAGNANCGGTPLTGSQITNTGTMCGTYTIGPTGAYTSLTAAVAAVVTNGVNCPLIFEFQAAYVSSVETFPIVIPFLGNGPTTTITARPELIATNLSITSAATQTIDFNGTSYFTFDGRPGGVGTVSHLTIENTSTTGTAVRFINGTLADGLNYIKVRGVTTGTTNGVIAFGNATTAAGNNNNTITNCDITSGATSAAILIYGSNATAGIANSGNTISNNLIYNWFGPTVADAAISVTGNSANWTISNNSFYQTASRTYTSAVTHSGINITASTGTLTGGFVITGNYLGGTAALCGGTAWTDLGTVAHRFLTINVTTGSSAANSIQGNTIRNFNFTTTSGATTTNGVWCGINLTGTGAIMNVGNITPNVIGSNTANSQIVTSVSTTGGMTVAINSSATGIVTITGNQIGGITANSSTVTTSSSINGILISSGFPVITNNIIGSTTLTNSLINAASTGSTGGHITGINSSAFSGAVVITGNTIANLTNQYAGTSTTGQTRGIISTSGSNTISGNTIAALSILSPQTGTANTSSVIGIGLQSTSVSVLTTQKVFGNTIGGLANGSLTGNVQVNGIIATSSTSVGYEYAIYNNSIQALGAPLTFGTSVTAGIQIYGGIGRVYNNMIVLGLDVLGNAVTQNQEYDGILKNTANRGTIMFNSVNIAGTGVAAGTNNTYAFRRANGPTAAPVDSVYSNIFVNNRSNGAGTGTHYAMQFAASTGVVSNNNDFYGTGTGYQMGAIGATNYISVAPWTAATTFDANSFGVNPNFLSNLNLHINNATQSVLESRAGNMNLNFDIDNQVRPGPTAVNGGGTGPDIGADEFDGIPVNVDYGVQLLVNPITTGCYASTETVRVRIKNYATTTVNMATNPVTINGSVTGPNPATFGPLLISSGTIPAGGTLDTAIATNYNMTAAGTYVFNASTSAAADFINSNDAMGAVTITISGGTVTVLPNPNCEGSATTMSVVGQTNGGAFQWQSSPDNITWTNIPSATTSPYTTNPNDTTFYRIVSCGLHNSTVDTVNTIHVIPAVTVNDTICGSGTVTLTASGSGTLDWYTSSTGGSPINSGTSYSPSITATTTYYVENTFTSGSAGAPATPTCYPVYSFACSSSDFINNVSTTGGITNISNLSTGCNGLAPNNTTFFPTQIVTTSPGSSFNFSCQAGTAFGQGFRIWIDYNNDGDFSDAGEDVLSFVSSTIMNTGVITVPTTTAPGPKRMRVMCRYATTPATTDYCLATASFGEVEEYTVMVGLLCSAVRTPVTGVVTPAPALTASSVNGQLCTAGTDSTLLIATGASANYVYTWSPATFLSTTNGDSTLFTPTAPGQYTYILDALDSVTGCHTADTIGVSLSVSPSVTAGISNDSICRRDTVTLTATPGVTNTTLNAGTLTNGAFSYPCIYGNFFEGNRSEILYLASDLSAAGMQPGYIGGLAFGISNMNNSVDSLLNFTIEMSLTSLTTLSATFQTAPMQTVFTDPVYDIAVGANIHTFSSPFYWDGVSNILIHTCYNNNTTTAFEYTENVTMRYASVPYNAYTYAASDNNLSMCTITTGTTMTNRPNVQFIASTASWTYAWTPVLDVINPAVQNATATPTATGDYIVTVTDTLTGCTASDTVHVYVKPTPIPNLGADTIICSNQPLLLDGSAGAYTYLWQDSTTNQTYSANVFGVYSVMVMDTTSGCSGSDSVLIGVNSAPAFSLGSDVTVCAGTQVTFSGPGGTYDYLWSNTDTTITTTTGTAGSYDLLVTDTVNGCFERDTVVLNVNALPVVALGADQTICSVSAPVILNGPAGNYTYLWNDASTNDSLTVNSTGTYFVTVTDTATTCFSGDTVMVTINNSPVVSLGNDSTQCGGSITVTAPAGSYNYLWQDASTNGNYTATSTETISVLVTDSVTGCATSDTVNVTINAIPVVNLGADSAQCGGSITLDAGVTTNGGYIWNDLSTGQTLVATTTGQYYVAVTDSTTGCNASDSVNITINTPPVVTFSIAQDSICTTDPALTLVGSPAGGTFSGPGVTGTTFNAATAGVGSQSITYDYTDANGCQATVSDVILVSACVGMVEPFNASSINVFPNPNNGMFTLTIKAADYNELSVEVVTVDGKAIYSDKASNVQGDYVKALDLTTHANGIYFLRVTANGQTFMQKIVKND